MTLICAIESKGAVIMCGDGLIGGDEGWRDQVDRPKFRRFGDILIGVAGSVRPTQIVETCNFRRQHRDEDDYDYILTGVAEHIRLALKDGDGSTENFSAIVAYHGKAYEMDGHCGFYRSSYGYHAVGSGAMLALGVLADTDGVEPQARMERVFRAAGRHCSHISPKYSYVTLEAKGKARSAKR